MLFTLITANIYLNLPCHAIKKTTRVYPNKIFPQFVKAGVEKSLGTSGLAKKRAYNRRPKPKVMGMKKYSTGMGRVWNTF